MNIGLNPAGETRKTIGTPFNARFGTGVVVQKTKSSSLEVPHMHVIAMVTVACATQNRL